MKAQIDRYGLFEWLPDGFPQWVEGTSDLKYAKERVKQLALKSNSTEYFVQDFIASVIVASTSEFRSGTRA